MYIKRTLPFRFHVPTKIVQYFVVEYSDSLKWFQKCFRRIGCRHVPVLQRRPNRIVNWVEYCDRTLSAKVSLRQRRRLGSSLKIGDEASKQAYQKHVDGNLLPFVLEVVDVRS